MDWISVNDKLPENHQLVLITGLSRHSNTRGRFYAIAKYYVKSNLFIEPIQRYVFKYPDYWIAITPPMED